MAKKQKEPQLGRVRLTPMKLSELKDAPYNPRVMDDVSFEGLKGSVLNHQLLQPIIWNKRTGHIVGGHQRKKVLEAQGVKITDVVVIDVDVEREKAINIALNNKFIQGEWNYEGLSELLVSMNQENLKFTFLPDSETIPLLRANFKVPAVEDINFTVEEKKNKNITCPKCGHVFSKE